MEANSPLSGVMQCLPIHHTCHLVLTSSMLWHLPFLILYSVKQQITSCSLELPNINAVLLFVNATPEWGSPCLDLCGSNSFIYCASTTESPHHFFFVLSGMKKMNKLWYKKERILSPLPPTTYESALEFSYLKMRLILAAL